ncbi:MAG: PAS domain-containing sensor histidine kinase [Candidatus Obscuribacterales bacterium]|nr:PAS domain-containing sensor histidine kinase [Candidatus Obscuribacterales bacterium]
MNYKRKHMLVAAALALPCALFCLNLACAGPDEAEAEPETVDQFSSNVSGALALLRTARITGNSDLTCKAEIFLDDCITAEIKAKNPPAVKEQLLQVKRGLALLCTEQLPTKSEAQALERKLELQLSQLLEKHNADKVGFAGGLLAPVSAAVLGFVLGALAMTVLNKRQKATADLAKPVEPVKVAVASPPDPRLQRSISQSYSMIDEILPLATASRDLAYFDNVPMGLVSVNEDGTIRSANARVAAMIGAKVSQLTGKSITDHLSLDPQGFGNSDTYAELRRSFNSGTAEGWLKNSEGQLIPVDLSSADFAARNKQGTLISILDRSARQEMEDLRRHFVSVVSHDLRTPLTSLGLFFQILRQSNSFDSEDYREAVVDAEHETGRLIKLVTDLLDISKLESGKFSLDVTSVEASTLAGAAVSSVTQVAKQKNVAIEVNCTTAAIAVDPDRIIQVLVNLLSNALQFTPPGSTIKLQGAITDGAMEFAVEDEGPGVPEAERERIFDRFVQATKQRKEGAGLGLAISNLIVQQHGGTISVEGAPNKGAIFKVRIPLNQR